MVCPNCQSTDIVELQNQHFCINCGRLIELVTKKRGPGRPKAERLDRPKPLTIALDKPNENLDKPQEDVAVKPLEITSVETEPTETAESTNDTNLADSSEVEVLVPSTKISHIFHQAPPSKLPSEVALSAEIKARKRLQDIVPVDTIEKVKVEPSSGVEKKLSPKVHLPLPQIISAAWSEPWQGGPARLLILAAFIAAMTAGGITSLMLNHVQSLNPTQALAGGICLSLGVAMLFGVANTERASFALRRYDHRPIPRSWLFGGALSVLGRQSLVVLGGIVDFAFIATLAMLIAQYLPRNIPQPYSPYALVVSYFLLSLLALAAWVKTGIATAGVELGRMKSLEALKFGWRSLWHHPELMGSRLVAILWVASSLAGIIALAWGLHLLFGSYDYWIEVIVNALLAVTAVLLGNFGAVGWRQAAYREIVIIDEAPDAIALLSGHHNGAPSRKAQYAYIFAVLILLIVGSGAIATSLF